MQRIAITERPRWRDLANSLGFRFHTIDGLPYWDESAYYQFSLREIEDDLEGPTMEIHEMCMDLVSRAVRDEEYLRKLDIPQPFWNWIAESYRRGDPHLYGRMDLAYDGNGPAKLYELNYDTPTSLYEAAVFQWVWLEQSVELNTIPKLADQFNSLHEKLQAAFRFIGPRLESSMYFSSVAESVEDRGTVDYLRDLASQTGLDTEYVAIEHIGRSANGQFTDTQDRLIRSIFKLYPWEYLFAEEFGTLLPKSDTTWFEPPWKSILSNKGALALLWELHPNHPNLLPTYFEERADAKLENGWVRKPLFSREGANVELMTDTGERVVEPGPYGDARYIRQAFHALPKFDRNYALVGSWVVGDEPAGIGIREDLSLITKDTARFIPHILLD